MKSLVLRSILFSSLVLLAAGCDLGHYSTGTKSDQDRTKAKATGPFGSHSADSSGSSDTVPDQTIIVDPATTDGITCKQEIFDLYSEINHKAYPHSGTRADNTQVAQLIHDDCQKLRQSLGKSACLYEGGVAPLAITIDAVTKNCQKADDFLSSQANGTDLQRYRGDVVRFQVLRPEEIDSVDLEVPNSQQHVLVNGESVLVDQDTYSNTANCQLLLWSLKKDEVFEASVDTQGQVYLQLSGEKGGYVMCSNAPAEKDPSHEEDRWTLTELQQVFGATATVSFKSAPVNQSK